MLALAVLAIRTPAPGSILLAMLQFTNAFVLLLAIGLRQPWGWYYILLSQYALLLLGLLGRPTSERPAVMLAELIYAVLISLYLARRRPQFRLEGWPFVM